MRRYPPTTTEFACALCIACELAPQMRRHKGVHRCLVNAGATAMFWGGQADITALVADADRASTGPGLICEANADGNLVVFLWLHVASEARVAEYYWPGCLETGDAVARHLGRRSHR